ncbi:sortase [Serpentinicella alkaliphila]|nr:sortase [Serpentinicella alkaliphila]
MFNRLEELEAGDKIVITTKGEKHEYTIYLKKFVEPTDLSVLNRNSKDRILSLITCDPINNPTHRIIIHAKM